MTGKQKLLLYSICFMVLFNKLNVTMMNVAIPEFRKVFEGGALYSINEFHNFESLSAKIFQIKKRKEGVFIGK
ncbi:hypothetical protein GCM10011409_35590 [Lentibacillus populi]|uniref:Uncharacterized protein n=1 Tax=Lentibacillus populi TaxID=1827502 RepID=A0A9W5U0A0_9BACI|nr:hypothetical protein GCM10011409_35590 [Lentibacillus populi]